MDHLTTVIRSSMAKNILVTGATGTVGNEVVKKLSNTGEIVRAAARSYNDAAFRDLNRVQVVQLIITIKIH